MRTIGPIGHLIIDATRGVAFLADPGRLTEAITAYRQRVGGAALLTVCDLASAWRHWRAAVPEPRTFTLREISQIAGTSYEVAHKWVTDGIIAASRRGRSGSGRRLAFTDHDAWVAALAGAMNRAGLRWSVIKTATDVLYGSRGKPQPSEATAARKQVGVL